VSLLHIHGDEDANLPIDGGTGEGISRTDFPSPRIGIRSLAEGDGCAAEPETTSDPPTTTETWSECNDDTTIEFVTVAGASHAWMGADAKTRPGATEPFAGYDSSLASWTFLFDHPRAS
jgi:poly(3-hydroxybutyrate) depolymerase